MKKEDTTIVVALPFIEGVRSVIPRCGGDSPLGDCVAAAAATSLWVAPDNPSVRRVPKPPPPDPKCPADASGKHCPCWTTTKSKDGLCHYCGASWKGKP